MSNSKQILLLKKNNNFFLNRNIEIHNEMHVFRISFHLFIWIMPTTSTHTHTHTWTWTLSMDSFVVINQYDYCRNMKPDHNSMSNHIYDSND